MCEYTFSIPYNSLYSDNQKYVGFRTKHINAAYTAMKGHICREMMKSKMSFKKDKIFVIIVQYRANMRNDTQNFIKLICDGIKLYTAREELPEKLRVGDNWFCVVTDWQIEKENPRIEITVRQ